jgi:hypothetical protein
MKQSFFRKSLLAGVLAGLQGLSTLAQAGQATTPSASEPATPQLTSSASTKPATAEAGQSEPAEPHATRLTQHQSGIDEILKMVQAGVSKDVMKTYIESTQVASHLSAADIVTLKEHSVPDDVTVALIKRSAELTAQASQAGGTNTALAKSSGTISLDALVAAIRRGQFSSGQLDPEGYDYFRYYYLYPRTLASANERLFSSPSFPVYPPYSRGYYSPWGFRPGPFGP